MNDQPPVTDAKFELVEHKLRIRWDLAFIAIGYVAIWIGVAFFQHNRVVSVTCVVLAALCYPVIALLAQIQERVSWAQAEALRKRLDPRLGWRKRAIDRH